MMQITDEERQLLLRIIDGLAVRPSDAVALRRKLEGADKRVVVLDINDPRPIWEQAKREP